MKLTKILAKNYKGFKSLELKLRSFNVIIGKNGSGKSTIARLVPFVMEALTSEKQRIDFSPLGIDLGAKYTDFVHSGNEAKSFSIGAEFYSEKGIKYSVMTTFIYNTVDKRLLTKEFIFKKNNQSCVEIELEDIKEKVNTYRVDGKLKELMFTPMLPSSSHINEFEGGEDYEQFLKELSTFKDVTNYLGPFRARAKRVYNHSLQEFYRVGDDGRNAPYILYNDSKNSGELCYKLKTWMETHFDGRHVEVKGGDFGFSVNVKNGDNENNIVDDGVGYSQFFPLIVSKFLSDGKKNIEVVEQPEIHLHPGVSSSVIELYFDTSFENKVIILETHSKEVALRLRLKCANAEGNRVSQNSQFVFTEKKSDDCQIDYIYIDENGDTDWWPEGIFEESYNEVKAINEAKRVSRNK